MVKYLWCYILFASTITLGFSHEKYVSIEEIVTVTAYEPKVSQTDDTPLITASNQTVRVGICAVSRDIEKRYSLEFGDKIHLEDIGTFEFSDRMNRRWKNRVDIFMWSGAKEFGVKTTTLKYILKKE